MRLKPAFGRDYHSKEGVLEAWKNGCSFVMECVTSPGEEVLINRYDAENGSKFYIQYQNLKRMVVVKT